MINPFILGGQNPKVQQVLQAVAAAKAADITPAAVPAPFKQTPKAVIAAAVHKTTPPKIAPPPPSPPPPSNIALDMLMSTFPPAAIIAKIPPGGEKVLEEVPGALFGSVFPPFALATGELPGQALMQAEQERQIDIIPDYILPREEKEEAKEMLITGWNAGKPAIIGGGTSIIDVVAPDFKLPGLPDFGDIGKFALIAGAAVAVIYLLGKALGR